MEDESSERAHVSEDVTGRGCVFAAVKPRSELTAWDEQVDVVCPNEILSHADDSRHQRHLAVVVSRLLSNRT